ncbi:hypothetical protein BDR03DRAFT_963485 [Suillus americanus]|nr:hypothetical protein BDR03DRAFT_963485 [Suillus americanus]
MDVSMHKKSCHPCTPPKQPSGSECVWGFNHNATTGEGRTRRSRWHQPRHSLGHKCFICTLAGAVMMTAHLCTRNPPDPVQDTHRRCHQTVHLDHVWSQSLLNGTCSK